MKLSVFLAALVALSLDAQPLPERGRAPDYMPSEEQWEDLKERWSTDGRPRFSIYVNDAGGASGPLLSSSFQNLLAAELGSRAVVDIDRLEALENTSAEMLSVAFGSGEGGASMPLKQSIEADILVAVDLIQTSRGVQPIAKFIDLRSGSVLASPSATTIDTRVRQWQDIYANALIKRFIEAYANEDSMDEVPAYTLAVSGFRTLMDADDCLFEIEDIVADDARAEIDSNIAPVGRDNFRLNVELRSNFEKPRRAMRRVARELERALEDAYLFTPVEMDERRLTALVSPAQVPEWRVLTDFSGADALAAKMQRSQALEAKMGGVRLGILVGRGIADDWPQLEIEGVKDSGEGLVFPPSALRTELQNYFSRMGFDVRDDAAVRDRIQQLGRIMEREGVSAINIESLADSDAFDLLAVVALRSDDERSVRVNARLLSRSDARFLGGMVGPSASDLRLGDHRVEPGVASSLARYIAGTLAARLDDNLASMERVLDVTVMNLESFEQLEKIRTLFEKMPAVNRVDRVAYLKPSGSFEIAVDDGREPKINLDFKSSLGRRLVGLDFSPVVASITPSSILIDAAPEKNSPPDPNSIQQRVDYYPPPFPEYVYTPPEGSIVVGDSDFETETQVEPLPAVGAPNATVGNDLTGAGPIIEAQQTAWAILIGVNDSGIASPLRACVSDAEKMARALVDHAGFARENIFLMTDKQEGTALEPNFENIQKVLHEFQRRVVRSGRPASEHTVVFHISTHGKANEDSGTTSLVVRDGLIQLENIRAVFQGMGLDNSIFIVDACQSGGANDEAVVNSLEVADQTTLAGCRRGQSSLEMGGPPPYGLLTSGIVYGLENGAADRISGNSDGSLDLFELYKFVYRYVSETAENSGAQQHPFLKVVTSDIPVISRVR